MLGLGLGLVLVLFLLRPLLEAAVAESSFHLPAPQNVTIVSYNFHNTIKWSPVMGINSSAVSYRIEYRRKSDITWTELISTNTTKPEYYFTDVITEFVEVIFRVRTEQGELKSDWVETSPFLARSHTILGPPREIEATVKDNSIFISYKAPFDNNSRFFVFQYQISYWVKSTDKDMPSDKVEVVNTTNTKYKLAHLIEMTEYCFYIQAVLPEKHLHGHLSDTYCKRTSLTETSRILFMTLPFVFAVFVLFLIVLCLMIIQKHQNIIKSLWRPPLTIPLHYVELISLLSDITFYDTHDWPNKAPFMFNPALLINEFNTHCVNYMDLHSPQMTVIEEFINCAGDDHWDSVSVISSVEQNPAVTNSTEGKNQEVNLLQTDDLR